MPPKMMRQKIWTPPSLWLGTLDPHTLRKILREDLDPSLLQGTDLLAWFARLEGHPRRLGGATRPLLVPGWTPEANGPVRWPSPHDTVGGAVSAVATRSLPVPLAPIQVDFASICAIANAPTREPKAQVRAPMTVLATTAPALRYADAHNRSVATRGWTRRIAAAGWSVAAGAAVLAVLVLPQIARMPGGQINTAGDTPWQSRAAPTSPLVGVAFAPSQPLHDFAAPLHPLAAYMTARLDKQPALSMPKAVGAAATKDTPLKPANSLPETTTIARGDTRPRTFDAALATPVDPTLPDPPAPNRRRPAKAKRTREAAGRSGSNHRPDVVTLLLPEVLKPQ